MCYFNGQLGSHFPFIYTKTSRNLGVASPPSSSLIPCVNKHRKDGDLLSILQLIYHSRDTLNQRSHVMLERFIKKSIWGLANDPLPPFQLILNNFRCHQFRPHLFGWDLLLSMSFTPHNNASLSMPQWRSLTRHVSKNDGYPTIAERNSNRWYGCVNVIRWTFHEYFDFCGESEEENR